jgi:rod shape-determining protein MreD
MMQGLVRYTIVGLLLVLLQVTVVNNMVLFNLVHPHVYFMLLLILPFTMPQWVVLLTCFGYGLVMDFFTYTPGIHASACVLVGFLRPHLLNFFTPVKGKGDHEAPHLQALGFGNFALYLVAFIFFHQLMLHFMEVFSFAEMERTLLRTFINTLSTWLLMMVIELLVFYRTVKE